MLASENRIILTSANKSLKSKYKNAMQLLYFNDEVHMFYIKSNFDLNNMV